MSREVSRAEWAGRVIDQRLGVLDRLDRPSAQRAESRSCPASSTLSNVGSARSSGVEVEMNGSARPGVDVFGRSATPTRDSATTASRAASTCPARRFRIRPTTPPQSAPRCRTGCARSSRVRSGRGGLLRAVLVRRDEHRRSGRLCAGGFSRRRPRPGTCRSKPGSRTRSTRFYVPVAFRTCRSPHRGSSARAGGRARSGSPGRVVLAYSACSA